MKHQEQFIEESFAVSAAVRYIAVYEDDQLLMRQRDAVANASSGESDKYEELIVNPALVKIATQRGNIDCGGLEYLIIRYGHFFVLLFPTTRGHVNFGIEPGEDPLLLYRLLKPLLVKFNYLHG